MPPLLSRRLPGFLLFWCMLLLSRTGWAAPLTVVSGHIEHPRHQVVALFLGTHPVTQQPLHRLLALLDAAGNFRLEVPELTHSQLAVFHHGEEETELWLTPGQSLQLTLDAEQFDESLRFQGPDANASNYLAQYYLRFEDFGDDLQLPPPPLPGRA